MGTWSHSEHTLSSAWDHLVHTEYALHANAAYFSACISKILGLLQYDFWLTGKEALRKGSRIHKMSLTSKVCIRAILWVFKGKGAITFPETLGVAHCLKRQKNKSELSASEIYVSKTRQPLYMFYEC